MDKPPVSRRGFLEAITTALLLVIGLVLLVPAAWYLLASSHKRGGKREFVDVGPVDDIPPGEWRMIVLEQIQQDGWRKTKSRHSIWVRRDGKADSDISVRSSICPHLGCPVNWNSERKSFQCPCHGAVFDPSGKRISGPPPRDLDPLQFEVRSGRLWVLWQDFKIGADEPIEVNL
jgi:Rieske Fe-S protein